MMTTMTTMQFGPTNFSQANNTCIDLTSNEKWARGIKFNIAGSALIVGIIPFFTVFGVTANLSFLFVVNRQRNMRTVTNAYLSNLGIADIMFLLSATITALIQYSSSQVVYDQLVLKTGGCAIVNCIIFLFFYESVFTVFLVSFERYSAICRPFHQRIVMGRARTTKLLIGTWVVAFMFSLMMIPSYARMKVQCFIWPETEEFARMPSTVGQCKPIFEWMEFVSNGLKIGPFFVAMFSSGYIYARIVRQLNKQIPGLANKRRYNNTMGRVLRSRRQITIMLIATGVIFFLCQAPSQISTLARMITDHSSAKPVLSPGQYHILQWISRLLLFINSAVNPIIYNVTNSRYRRAFAETYRCHRTKKFTFPSSSTMKSTLSSTKQFYNPSVNINHLELNTVSGNFEDQNNKLRLRKTSDTLQHEDSVKSQREPVQPHQASAASNDRAPRNGDPDQLDDHGAILSLRTVDSDPKDRHILPSTFQTLPGDSPQPPCCDGSSTSGSSPGDVSSCPTDQESCISCD